MFSLPYFLPNKCDDYSRKSNLTYVLRSSKKINSSNFLFNKYNKIKCYELRAYAVEVKAINDLKRFILAPKERRIIKATVIPQGMNGLTPAKHFFKLLDGEDATKYSSDGLNKQDLCQEHLSKELTGKLENSSSSEASSPYFKPNEQSYSVKSTDHDCNDEREQTKPHQKLTQHNSLSNKFRFIFCFTMIIVAVGLSYGYRLMIQEWLKKQVPKITLWFHHTSARFQQLSNVVKNQTSISLASKIQMLSSSVTTSSFLKFLPAWLLNCLRSLPQGTLHAFSLVLFSEIGDKTFFLAAVLAIRHGAFASFTGSVAALFFMTLISVAIGIACAKVPSLVQASTSIGEIVAILLFAIFGSKSIFDAVTGGGGDEECVLVPPEAVDNKAPSSLSGRVNPGPAFFPFLNRGETTSSDAVTASINSYSNIHNRISGNQNRTSDRHLKHGEDQRLLEARASLLTITDMSNQSNNASSYSSSTQSPIALMSMDERHAYTFGDGRNPDLISTVGTSIEKYGRLTNEVGKSADVSPEDMVLICGDRQALSLKQRLFEIASLIFLAEWGDRSMLATVVLSAKQGAALGVCLGATTGHAVASALAVLFGGVAARHLSERTANTASGVIFIFFAAIGAMQLMRAKVA